MDSKDQRILPPAGSRLSMAEILAEWGHGNVRAGMGDTGTWIGLPAGTRHGFDSYWGKASIALVGTLQLRMRDRGEVLSSNAGIIRSLYANRDGSSDGTTITGLKPSGYLKLGGSVFPTGSACTFSNNSNYQNTNLNLHIAGVHVMNLSGSAEHAQPDVVITLEIWN